MDVVLLKKIIQSNSVFSDPIREKGKTPPVLQDIYRSDFGELLTTYYFEEKLPEGERYVIPLKNISQRERFDKPGRGIDAIGYRKENDGSYTLLLSEAKVSSEKKNPPAVVDRTKDSIYNTQKIHHDNKLLVLQRLTEYVRHLSSSEDVLVLGCMIIWMENDNHDKYNITYGCGLVRDTTCCNHKLDFGKMKTNADDFKPVNIDFAIFSFTEKTIEETVDLFYRKVSTITK